MTVRELKEWLERYDDDMRVVVDGREVGFSDIGTCERVALTIDVYDEWLQGSHELTGDVSAFDNEGSGQEQAILLSPEK